jgi:hypothetical protein
MRFAVSALAVLLGAAHIRQSIRHQPPALAVRHPIRLVVVLLSIAAV